MNIKMIFHTLGKILLLEAIFLLFPLIVSLIYQENTYLSFILPILGLTIIGLLLSFKKPKNQEIGAKEGFVLVGLSWIVLSLFGCLPFFISKQIPSFVDAFFETVSGFTTTGSTILDDIESLSHSMLFWRSFTHWIGGMGILVFILAILPNYKGQNIFILKAESAGPQVGKIVSKVKVTARILYVIYIALTLLEIIFLLFGKMPLFDSIINAFSTAGTGGFSSLNNSIAGYHSDYLEFVIAIFMVIFSINFSLFYLILIGNVKKALKSEELHKFFLIIITSIIIIMINLINTLDYSYYLAFKDSLFQVSSIISTTGFSNTNYGVWPTLSKVILFILMFIGGCAGSTAGGLKVSRIIIAFKVIKRNIIQAIHPSSVSTIKFEDQAVDEKTISNVTSYICFFFAIFACSLFIISFDNFDIATNITTVASCLNNVGPALGELIGPTSSFSAFSDLSKITLSLTMLIGRLEIFPIILLFSPSTWKNN